MGAPKDVGRSDVARVGLLCLTTAFFWASMTMLQPLAPLFSASLGASPVVVGIIAAVAFLLPFALAIPVGSLVDRRGPHQFLVAGAVAHGLAPLGVAAFPGYASLVTCQLIVGVAQLFLIVSAQTYVALLSDGVERERNFGWFSTFNSLGQLAGPLLGGLLVDAFGFRAAFAAAGALLAFPVFSSIWLWKDDVRRGWPGRGQAASPESSPSPAGDFSFLRHEKEGKHGRRDPLALFGNLFGGRGELRALLSNPGIEVGITASCAALFAMGVRQAFLPVYLESLQFPATTIGFLLSLRAFVSVFTRPFMPAIIRMLGGRGRTLVVTVLLGAIGIGSVAFLTSFVPLALAAILVGLGVGLSQPLTMIVVSDHAQPGRQGYALGVRLTANRLAQLLSPMAFGFIVEAAGYAWGFLGGGFVLLITAFLVARRVPDLERAEELLRQGREPCPGPRGVGGGTAVR